MKVTIISPKFPDPIHYIAEVARICYGKEFEEVEKDDLKTTINLLNRGHHTPFESIYVEWYIENISRAAATQALRHRHTSPLQQSQRYVNYKNNNKFWDNMVIPELDYLDTATKITSQQLIEGFLTTVKTYYNNLIKLGARPEDARCILPQCSPTNIKLGMNLREFLFNFYPLRASRHAQVEIREIADKMMSMLCGYFEDDKLLEFIDIYFGWIEKQNRPEWK